MIKFKTARLKIQACYLLPCFSALYQVNQIFGTRQLALYLGFLRYGVIFNWQYFPKEILLDVSESNG